MYIFSGITQQKLITAAIVAGVILLCMFAWVFILVPATTKLANRLKINWLSTLIAGSKKPVSIMLIVSAILFSLRIILVLPATVMATIFSFYRVFLIYCIAWGLVNSKGIVKDFLTKEKNNTKNETVIIFLTRIYSAVVVVFAVLMSLSELSFDVTGILTGLGLGSLTFALAAQDAASNFFGGFIIITERPFEVGDWISADIIEGSVEDITFRNTKIRTIDGSLTVVPNSKLAGGALTNWTQLNHRLMRFNIGLMYNTEKDTIKKVSHDIAQMLETHCDIEKETVEVCLNEFASSSIDLFVTCYVKHVDIVLYRKTTDDVNYKILDIMQKNNASFAFPSQSVYFENALGITK